MIISNLKPLYIYNCSEANLYPLKEKTYTVTIKAIHEFQAFIAKSFYRSFDIPQSDPYLSVIKCRQKCRFRLY